MSKPQGILLFSHPDDSFIFAHNLIKRMDSAEWTDCVATYTPESSRGQEFIAACGVMGTTPMFLGLEDDMYKPLDFSKVDLDLNKYDIVVTHNPVGEYFHPHHKNCHSFVKYNYNGDFIVPAQNYLEPEFRYFDAEKINSPIVKIYEREAYIMYNFNLLEESFVTIRRET